MGQFANALFSALLGWVQTAVSALWGLMTNSDASHWFLWLLENWLPLTLMLCAAGLLIDFIVYLIRWQPYRVWRSFLNRRAEKKQTAPADFVQLVNQRKWVYADGSTAMESDEPSPYVSVQQEPKLTAPIAPTRRLARRSTPEQAYHQPVYPPQWQQNTQDYQGDNE